MSRKETPDILGALMGEISKPESGIAVEQESNKAIKPASNKAVRSENQKIIKTTIGLSRESGAKEKATFNLSKTVLVELEDCWVEIRRLRGDKRISKTDIVEQALEEALNEFRLKRGTGKFYGKLDSNKTIKQ